MEQLFRDFWWLMFPLAWLVSGSVSSFFNYQRQRRALELIRTYAERGQEPPQALIDLIQKPIDPDAAMWDAVGSGSSSVRGPTNYWSLVALFAAMSLGFAGAGYFTDLDRGSGAFYLVAVTMGAVGIWALVNALMQRRAAR